MTRWIDRFTEAMTLLCGGNEPPRQIVLDWFDREKDSFELQEFALCNSPLSTAQGIGIIDAAMCIADQPEEGKGHELRDG
jgi:hypothetical protein